MKKSSVHLLGPQVFLRFILASFILLFAQSAFANLADRTVKGRVTDATTGSALSGATISVKGSSSSSITDAKGEFSVTVANDKSTVIVSFLGYTTQEVFVGTRSTINIQLQTALNDKNYKQKINKIYYKDWNLNLVKKLLLNLQF